ncbi:metal-dependent transcriptional regulator [Arcanobacterium hippocoleae]
MQETQLSQSNEDYLKNIWLLGEQIGKAVGVRALARRMRLSPSTVSEAMKKLTEHGYVDHHRYAGITLTETGRKIAIQMARKHRLIETYLVRQLNYGWDEVHDEAEALEHAVSNQFVARIDEILGYPETDPHGDPIPNADGKISHIPLKLLSEIDKIGVVKIQRVSDEDSEVLAYLAEAKLLPGTRCEIKSISQTLGSITLTPYTNTHPRQPASDLQITFPVAKHIWVAAD